MQLVLQHCDFKVKQAVQGRSPHEDCLKHFKDVFEAPVLLVFHRVD